ncbi:MAG: hypothetical protein KBS81_03520, partial [Spirochaetales bacterium]|nr:hypothetical protein [Candidatus Physcosoma equi]
PVQSDAKPYSVAKVRALFSEILASSSVTEGERAAIEELEKGFAITYGEVESPTMMDALQSTGYLTLVQNEDLAISAGAKFTNQDSVSLLGDGLDIRNKATAYILGNVEDAVSFYMDFSLLLDKVDHRTFLASDFTHECEGWYQDLGNEGEKDMTSPFSKLRDGLAMNPEVAATLFDNALSVRFASVKRDWGPARNNLALASSARPFDGLEFTYAPSDRFSLSWLIGSLGKSYLVMDGEALPLGDLGLHSNLYDNNFTLQRVEVTPIKGLKLSIFESVVWRKRFELAYMNPLCIYMFAQNYIGDFDNMLAGADFSYTLPGVGKFYGALAIDELNSANPKKMISWARNIVALQGGVKMPLPVFSFGELTLQATYIPPFFGTHYEFAENPWGSDRMGIAYVNKGQPLSYPVTPDSVELLASLGTTVPGGVSVDLVVKDQMRSAQYATSEKYGTTLHDIIAYSHSGEYAEKDFFSYIWDNTLSVSVTGKYSFGHLPLSLTASLEGILDTRRDYSFAVALPESGKEETGRNEDGDITVLPVKYNNGKNTIMGSDWNSTFRLIGRVGFSLYY